ncbi:DUF6493 family protein [Streptomyces sp. NBC_00572]|uniref:DUF7824 domain-containing protein n=1 Tax=Streptomyces sp. NBC_00572 TaxID=2903664 RepID=UPI00224E6378|nr:DUF6493 family protein [Streptomyces sp. NBC_00572]MCX4986882.1 DUF6493 family protein [Streptomyces sp. NBC_00572]
MGIENLVEAVRGGKVSEVPALVKPLDAAERRTALARLKELRTEMRRSGVPRVQHALYVAGAGCHPGAAAAATWLGGRDLLPWRSEGSALVLDVVADRTPEWMADVAVRLAARPSVAEHSYKVIRGLVERSGCAVPATDGYVLAWAWELGVARRYGRKAEGPALLQRLRQDPQTPALLVHALSMPQTPEKLTWAVEDDSPEHWPTAVVALVGEKVLDRTEVVDAAVSRLLRGGRLHDLRFPLEVLRLVEPAAEEFRERVPDFVGMAADAPSPVAGYAQEVLGGLAADGALSTAELAEMTGAVLFRTEKKLVRAQLTMVGKVLAREPGSAGELLPVLAEVFGHEDTDLQERALKLVARHLSDVDGSVRRELVEQARELSPVHRRTAEELFGEPLGAGGGIPYEEILPPVPEPRRAEAPVSTIEALVEEMLAKGVSDDPVRFERALDGLVRHAHRDRAGLTRAIREAFRIDDWQQPHHFTHHSHGLHAVLAALLGLLDRSWVEARAVRGPEATACPHEALTGITDARLWEAGSLIGTDALPYLLATPTLSTGGIEPLVLVERLRGYREADIEPAPVDLAQALLRVLRTDPDAARAAEDAATLDTAAGRRLAVWLRTAEPVAASVRFLRREEDRTLEQWSLRNRVVVEIADRAVVREEFPPAFRWLGGALEATPRRCYHWVDGDEHWAAVLPADREVLAACVLPSLARAVDGNREGTESLTGMAEAEGRDGRAVSLALALGLGNGDADDRLRAIDALLVLASRGDLDGVRLGTELAWLVAEGSVKPNRLADALRTTAATGAYATVWTVLGAALPELLGAEKPVRGLGEVLAVAADCAERCGAGGEVPGLDTVASTRGTSQFLVQARRLLGALRQGADQALTETA